MLMFINQHHSCSCSSSVGAWSLSNTNVHAGALIGTQLALPLLQDRLDARALEFAAQRAKMAESEVIRMEVRWGRTRGWRLGGARGETYRSVEVWVQGVGGD